MNFGLGIMLSFTDKASSGITGVVGAFKTLDNTIDGSMSRIDKIADSMTSLGGTLTMLSAPLVGFVSQMWSAGVSEASAIQNISIALETLMGSAELAKNHLGAVTRFSYETPFEYVPLVQASQALLGMGQNTEQSIKTLRLLGDAAGATGKQFGFVQDVIDIMGKIQAETKIGTQRLQQLARAGVDY